jgi:hypothetical protein
MFKNYLVCMLFLTTLIGASVVAASSGTTELVANGGFESNLDGWKLYVYDEIYGRVNETSGASHSGMWSLRTYANSGGVPYTQKRGGGVLEVLSPSVKDLNMTLSFWVMPAIVGQNSYTNIRSLIHMELKDGRSLNLSYYVAWAPPALGEFLYNTSDSTIFFLPALLHQWSYVQRKVRSDFESRYGNADGVMLSFLTVNFELTTVSHLTTPDAFWDDLSIIAETQPSTSPQPTQTTTPAPNQPQQTQIAPTVTSPKAPVPKQPDATSSYTEKYALPIVLIVAIIIGLTLVARRIRSRESSKTDVATNYCFNCGTELALNIKYCTRCGAKQ